MSRGDWTLLSAILLLLFLFYGEPDVFDALQRMTIAYLTK